MTPEEMKTRTKQFALRVMRMADAIPKRGSGDTIARQLFRCSTSVGANYRAACRARSGAEFIAKMGIVEEEADECLYWMEILVEADLMPNSKLAPLKQEAREILSITVSSIQTARGKKRRRATEESAIRNSQSEMESPK